MMQAVIPAEAGIQSSGVHAFRKTGLRLQVDPRLRGDDDSGRSRDVCYFARWLSATLPRIIAPAMPILIVSGSSSSSQAQATPKTGIR